MRMPKWVVVMLVTAVVSLMSAALGAGLTDRIDIESRLSRLEGKMDAVMEHLGVPQP